jgi:hypothetical protein
MADLYERLEEVGFPSAYVRAHILPDWWADDLAAYSFNRRVAELSIARSLKIPLGQLTEAATPLTLFAEGAVRFKHWQDVEQSALLPSVAIAKRVAELILHCAPDLPPVSTSGFSYYYLRKHLLGSSLSAITLSRLLDLSWKLGIPVFHLGSLPQGAKRVVAHSLPLQTLVKHRHGCYGTSLTNSAILGLDTSKPEIVLTYLLALTR